MAQLTKTVWDSTYNSSGSGSFKNNTSQFITEATLRQFSKDIEDSIPFLTGTNNYSVTNQSAMIVSGNTTSNAIYEISLTRSGTASLAQAHGSGIVLLNSDSNKGVGLQNSDDYFQIFNLDGSSWHERLRIRPDGVVIIGTQGSGEDNTGSNGLVSYFTSAFSDIAHLNGDFYSNQTVATSHSIQGVEGYVNCSHTSGVVHQAISTIGNFELSGSANVDEARSVNAGGVITGAGTLTNWYLYWCGTGPITGAVTNGYGLYVDTYKSGFTNKYGVFVNDSTAKNGFGANTPTATIDIAASTTSWASVRIRSGTAPTSPNDGDMWYDGLNVKFRVGGTTKTFTLT